MGIDKVAANNFYKDKGDHTKQNWFLYEYSNILYSELEKRPGLAAYRKNHDESDIVAFCVYFSKRMRQSVFNAQTGLAPVITVNGRYVYEFYPKNTYAQTQKLLEAANDAWSEHMFACSVCPNLCLAEGFEITDMFDNLEKTGWPVL